MPKTPPAKPRPDFPLFAHRSGQWCKTIKGKHHYFGTWDDPQAAEKRYAAERDDLYAGRTPSRGDGLNLVDLCNAFLTAKTKQKAAKELTEAEFIKYKKMCERVLRVFGRTTHVSNLRPADFEMLRADFAKKHSPVTLTGDIARTRAMFAYCASTFEIHAKYGNSFSKPSKTVLRRVRAAKPRKLFTAAEVRTILDHADIQMKAMVMLAINCGFGNDDVTHLTTNHVDLQGKWVNYHRKKTGVDRRCALWTETVKSIRDALASRPEPKLAEHKHHIFITKYGSIWSPKSVTDSPISNEMGKLLTALGIKREGVNFYALRHTFETVARDTRDRDAIDAVMGHLQSDIGSHYNEGTVSDVRLKDVSDHVRKWLFPRRNG
jgi:integrase